MAKNLGSSAELGVSQEIHLDLLEAYMNLRFTESPQLWGDGEYHRPSVEWWRNHDYKDKKHGFGAVLHAELEANADNPNRAVLSRESILEGVKNIWTLIDTGEHRLMSIDSEEAANLQERLLDRLNLLQTMNRVPEGSEDIVYLQKRKVKKFKGLLKVK